MTMNRHQDKSQQEDGAETESGFTDPGRKPWVWLALVCLLAGMVPVWPISGSLWGIPGWAVFAVIVSVLASMFIMYVVLFVWRDPEDNEEAE